MATICLPSEVLIKILIPRYPSLTFATVEIRDEIEKDIALLKNCSYNEPVNYFRKAGVSYVRGIFKFDITYDDMKMPNHTQFDWWFQADNKYYSTIKIARNRF